MRLWRGKRRNLLLKSFSTAPPKRLNTKQPVQLAIILDSSGVLWEETCVYEHLLAMALVLVNLI